MQHSNVFRIDQAKHLKLAEKYAKLAIKCAKEADRQLALSGKQASKQYAEAMAELRIWS